MNSSYFEIQKNGVSPFQNFLCYLGGSAIQTVGDNPVTACGLDLANAMLPRCRCDMGARPLVEPTSYSAASAAAHRRLTKVRGRLHVP